MHYLSAKFPEKVDKIDKIDKIDKRAKQTKHTRVIAFTRYDITAKKHSKVDEVKLER